MIAVDTNILVYAHRRESPFHEAAKACVRELAEGNPSWAIPWPCVHEFLAITTNPKIFKHPTPIAAALAQVDHWRESPSLKLIGEDESYWSTFAELVRSGQIRGAKVHDARIAALALAHGVRELLSADRDFTRMAPLAVRNPLRS
jgi:toxin-antitoxin system PIN domain toxin